MPEVVKMSNISQTTVKLSFDFSYLSWDFIMV